MLKFKNIYLKLKNTHFEIGKYNIPFFWIAFLTISLIIGIGLFYYSYVTNYNNRISIQADSIKKSANKTEMSNNNQNIENSSGETTVTDSKETSQMSSISTSSYPSDSENQSQEDVTNSQIPENQDQEDAQESSENNQENPEPTTTAPSSPTYMIALGDSVTQAASPNSSMIGDNPSYSFSTGTNINSIYLYLNGSIDNLNALNFSVSGAKSADVLNSQINQISTYNPTYVTLLIGGNDMLSLLSGNPVTPEQFQLNLESIADSVQKDGRTVLIGNIPNYGAMWQAEYKACSNYPYNQSLVSWAINQYNSIISSVASSHSFTLVDLYPYLDSDDVSNHDCLHPNLQGQQIIADRFKAGL